MGTGVTTTTAPPVVAPSPVDPRAPADPPSRSELVLQIRTGGTPFVDGFRIVPEFTRDPYGEELSLEQVPW